MKKICNAYNFYDPSFTVEKNWIRKVKVHNAIHILGSTSDLPTWSWLYSSSTSDESNWQRYIFKTANFTSLLKCKYWCLLFGKNCQILVYDSPNCYIGNSATNQPNGYTASNQKMILRNYAGKMGDIFFICNMILRKNVYTKQKKISTIL